MEPCQRCHAYANLVKSLESQLAYYRADLNKTNLVNHEAIATLASEREANAQLTQELEDALKKIEQLSS